MSWFLALQSAVQPLRSSYGVDRILRTDHRAVWTTQFGGAERIREHVSELATQHKTRPTSAD